MTNLQFPPLADSIFIEDRSKLVTMPSWILWLTHVGNLLSGGSSGSVLSSTTSKIGAFTRDMTAESATIAYTGIGFKPANVIFLSSAYNSSISVGLDNGTTAYCIHISGYANMYIGQEGALSIHAIDYNTFYTQSARISDKSSDGFSLNWYKVGNTAPNTLYVQYIAYK